MFKLNKIANFLDTHPIGRVFKLGQNKAVWKRVSELTAGVKIAIEKDGKLQWDEIVEIKSVGRERVYDIEVAGTHNFVANGIIAHNTYISGNVGIGTTAPTQKLDVNGYISAQRYVDSSNSAYYLDPANSTSLIVAGNVGIGTTGPSYKLDVSGDINFTGALREDGVEILSGMIAPFAGSCPTGWSEYTGARGRVVVGTPSGGTNAGTVGTALTDLGTRTITDVPSHRHTWTAPTSRLAVNAGSGSGWEGSGSEYTSYTGSASVDVSMPYIQLTYCQKSAGADLAEWTPSSQPIEKTNIVSVDPNNTEKIIISSQEYDPTVIGIIATNPGWQMGTEDKNSVQMALAGRVPTKVTLKNGEIKPGDPITTSTIPGIGMKATKAGSIVGKAMEAFNETSSTYNCQDPTTGRNEKCGTILVFVNVSWADPTLNNTNTSTTDNSQLFYDQVTFDNDFGDGDLVSIFVSDSPSQNNSNTLERVTHVNKSTESDKQSFAGIISTQIGGNGDLLRRERVNNQIISETRLVSSGRTDARVSPTSENISYGDPLIVSQDKGMLKKTTKAGVIIGRSLEQWNPSSGKQKIAVNISPTVYLGEDVFLTDSGNLNIAKDQSGNYQVTNAANNNSIIDRIGAYSKLLVANFEAGIAVISGKLISPVVQTNLISPLADESDVNVGIGKINEDGTSGFGKLIIEDATGSAVASISSEGDATFSGQLTAESASISGQLYAESIVSPDLDKIQELLRQVKEDQDLLAQAATWNTNTASASSQLIDNLSAVDLFVTGQAAISSLSVSNSLSIGTDLVIQGSGINTLTAPLSLQSLAMAPVEIMAGKFKIETNGNVAINADLFVSGQIEAKSLKAKEVVTEKLIIAMEATPSASLEASSSGIIKSNAAAGSATLPAGLSELVIENSKIEDSSLVYVTPTSTTQNNVLYVKSKELGKFTVGLSSALDIDVSFNWWVIETK